MQALRSRRKKGFRCETIELHNAERANLAWLFGGQDAKANVHQLFDLIRLSEWSTPPTDKAAVKQTIDAFFQRIMTVLS
jgi:hypothetical protein